MGDQENYLRERIDAIYEKVSGLEMKVARLDVRTGLLAAIFGSIPAAVVVLFQMLGR